MKFIRLAESMIEKNGEGIVAFITNYGYLSNPTFRGMRWHLMRTFENIYILDLHGNSKKKESAPDGSSGANIFDIQQGVAIIAANKTKNSTGETARIFHRNLWSSRKEKYKTLWDSDTRNGFSHIHPKAPYFMLYPINSRILDEYDAGLSLSEFMPINQKGIITARDHLAIAFDRNELEEKLMHFADETKSDSDIRKDFF